MRRCMRWVGVAVFGIMAVAVMIAQQATQVDQNAAVAFEVASVRPNKSGDRGGSLRRQAGGYVNAVNMPLNTLITFAYQVPMFMLAGGPGWIANERFDLVAKLDGDPPPVAPGSGSDPLMLAMRALLTDRFKLKVHRETREGDIYALVMARPGGNRGPALKPSTQDCSPQGIQARRAAPPPTASGGVVSVACGMQMAPGRIGFGGLPLLSFVNGLSGQVERVVVDRTGLSGNWDFELTFAAERPAWLPPGEELPAADPTAPSIFTAIQEQLGLRLQAAKGPVDVLVIDHVERPNEN
jgi:uncharacterized protein (TIGR03435 family)